MHHCITIYHNACIRIGTKHDPVIQVQVCTRLTRQAFRIADSNAFDVKVAATIVADRSQQLVGELSADELVTGLMQQWPQSQTAIDLQPSELRHHLT